MPVRKSQLALLEPYLVGEDPHPGKNGREWDMYCPVHEDSRRSASLNVDTGEWHCHACGGGGTVASLIRQQSEWVPRAVAAGNGHGRFRSAMNGGDVEIVTEAMIKGWISSLRTNEARLEELMARRGLDEDTLRNFEIGWDNGRNCYTIPVRDPDGEIWNVRRYQFDPAEGRRKIWGVKGMNSPRLYPVVVFDDEPEEIIVCGGEWDTLLTIQSGIPAITRTAAEDVWDMEWSQMFKGVRRVYVCHDMDDKGAVANRKVVKALQPVVPEIFEVELPFKRRKKNGKDLSDFWLEGATKDDFFKLASRRDTEEIHEPETLDPADASVLDSFDARKVGDPLRLTVTVKGKREPGYSVPRHAKLTCTQDAGNKCRVCPMNAAGGTGEVSIDENDPEVLELIESSKPQVGELIRKKFGAVKCSRLDIEVDQYQSVEVLFARPSVAHTSGKSDDYKTIKLTSVGRHDTMPNNTVQVIGSLYPEPRKQLNEFLVWDVKPLVTGLDNYGITDDDVKLMSVFQPDRGQRPLKKLGRIAKDLSDHVTRIYGRPELHAAMDLVFHSVLGFEFAGHMVERGWLELLVVGDTRTGKSEAAEKLVRHFQAGEIVTCESASFAGVVGGVQQYGSNKEWSVTWGAVPLNDRRLVVLDEISGLSYENIAQMSDVRSRGLAQITKIQQEVTHARTRLIWLGNPRDTSMRSYTYGVQAIKPLIGNPEDVARFDIAMSAMAGDVPADEINRTHGYTPQRYDSRSCSALVRWVWSRKPDQVVWAKGVQDEVRKSAGILGRRYVDDPPLIQAANVRIKIARVAVALAARLFSTDKNHENIVVRKEHVEDAVAFMDRIYSMQGFGYAELSAEKLRDIQEAAEKSEDVKSWLVGRRGMAKFLRSTPEFRRQDVEEVMNVSREEANAIINTLWGARMIRKGSRGEIHVEPSLHSLLREVRE
jgi:hypothetical protein